MQLMFPHEFCFMRELRNLLPIKTPRKEPLWFFFLSLPFTPSQVTCDISDHDKRTLPKISRCTTWVLLTLIKPLQSTQFMSTHTHTHTQTHTVLCTAAGAASGECFGGFGVLLKDVSVMEWKKSDQCLTVYHVPTDHEEQTADDQPLGHSCPDLSHICPTAVPQLSTSVHICPTAVHICPSETVGAVPPPWCWNQNMVVALKLKGHANVLKWHVFVPIILTYYSSSHVKKKVSTFFPLIWFYRAVYN